MDKLNAVTLKQSLWETLHGVKSGDMDAPKGDAVAAQAREILRTIKTQVSIIDKARMEFTNELKEFAVPKL